MDGYPKPKNKKYKGNLYSETRYAVIKFLEVELPKLKGDVLDIGAGNWDLPKRLLGPGVIYETLDQRGYGKAKNKVQTVGDVHKMPTDWGGTFDAVLCIEAFECFKNPFVAIKEIYRVLVPGGVAIITAPFNYIWFGTESWDRIDPYPVKDYWRISKDGWRLLMEGFSKVEIKGHGGTSKHDRFGYLVKGTK